MILILPYINRWGPSGQEFDKVIWWMIGPGKVKEIEPNNI
jgi:hypothetical protein